jgi:hypothetical protein
MVELPKIEPTPSHRPPPMPKGRVVVPLVISFVLMFVVITALVQKPPQGDVLGNDFVAGVAIAYGTPAGTLVAVTALLTAVWLRRHGRKSLPMELVATVSAWLVLAWNVVVPVWYFFAD